jgi:hypothetical protein
MIPPPIPALQHLTLPSAPCELVRPARGGYNLRQMRLRSVTAILALTMLLGTSLSGCALATKAPPRAHAGPDILVHVGGTVSYDGSLSVDLDGGNVVYYQWSITAAPEGREDQIGRVLREGEDAAVWATETPMQEEDLGEWTIELKVTDDEGQSATDDLILTVAP